MLETSRRNSTLGGLPNLHVLPSSLEFITIQDRLVNIIQQTLVHPVEVLSTALEGQLDAYDVVLIDCPPSLGLVTKNGLRISDYFLVPGCRTSAFTHQTAPAPMTRPWAGPRARSRVPPEQADACAEAARPTTGRARLASPK